MNFDLRALLRDLGSASTRTKALALMTFVVIVALVSVASVWSAQPHYITLYGGLDDAERVAVERALAEGAVRYRVSNFPGPYAVYVDESQFDRAQIQVALAEALKRAPTGINTTEGGASSIFMSSGERAQTMLKREWQETEHLLTQFDFVQRATVTTSTPDPSLLRKREPLTVSVALKLRGNLDLSNEQAENVARLVRFRFGVPPQNVVITDQSGHTVYAPGSSGEEANSKQLLAHAASFDRDLTGKVNDALQRAFGEEKAYVTITSEWDTDQSTVVAESLEGDPREVSVNKTESRTPGGTANGPGGAAGSAANLSNGFGGDPAGAATFPAEAVTKDERTTYEVPRTRTQTVRVVPQLRRLNVSLVVDASLGDKKDEIRTLVASAVGLDEKRRDVLGVTVADMSAAHPAAQESGVPSAEEGGSSGPSPMVELLLRRGVEIASALTFVVLLFASLRGARKGAPAASGGQGGGAAGGPGGPGAVGAAGDTDPAELARARIEELVRSDPRRVGEILSRWAGEQTPART